MVHVVHVVEEARCASAARKHNVFELSHFAQHAAFQVAKALLALVGKNVGYTGVKPFLDIPVEIVERKSQPFGKRTSDRGFSHTHIAYQYDTLHVDDELASEVMRWAETEKFSPPFVAVQQFYAFFAAVLRLRTGFLLSSSMMRLQSSSERLAAFSASLAGIL